VNGTRSGGGGPSPGRLVADERHRLAEQLRLEHAGAHERLGEAAAGGKLDRRALGVGLEAGRHDEARIHGKPRQPGEARARGRRGIVHEHAGRARLRRDHEREAIERHHLRALDRPRGRAAALRAAGPVLERLDPHRGAGAVALGHLAPSHAQDQRLPRADVVRGDGRQRSELAADLGLVRALERGRSLHREARRQRRRATARAEAEEHREREPV
jgi:hypothetical protein